MSLRNPKISFIIPTNRHEVDWLIKDILAMLPEAQIIVVDDGKGLGKSKRRKVSIIRHKSNLGLAQSLLDGYQEALLTEPDFIIRADADKEYPITHTKGLVGRLVESEDYCGAYVETKRTIQTSGLMDGLFHNIFGFVEGLLLLGKPMHQHSPGLHIYKAEVVRNFLPKLRPIVEKYELKWGLDLVCLTLAQESGKLVQFTADNPNWKERRPLRKIISQAVHATKIVYAMRRYSYNQDLVIDPESSF